MEQVLSMKEWSKLSVKEKRSYLKKMKLSQSNSEIKDNHYPLSLGQKALWVIQELEPENYAYNCPCAYKIQGSVDRAALNRAINSLVKRNRLQTRIVMEQEPIQIIDDKQEVFFETLDVANYNDMALNALIENRVRKAFVFNKGPLIRFHLFSRAEEEHIFLITIHHIIFDGTSALVLINDLINFYDAEVTGKQLDLPPLQTVYADFVKWQYERLNSETGVMDRDYWRKHLSGDLPVLNFLTDKSRKNIQTFNGAFYEMELSKELTSKIKEISITEKVNTHTFFLAVYCILLHRYSGQEEIIVGTPFAGRSRTDFETLIGFFVNMVPIRSEVQQEALFKDFLQHIREKVLKAMEHGNYPFFEMVNTITPDYDRAHTPIFQAAFALQNWMKNLPDYMLMEEDQDYKPEGLHLQPIWEVRETGEFDLFVEVIELSNKCLLFFKYNPDLFEHETIVRFATHYREALKSVVFDTRQVLSEINLLPQEELEKLLIDFNNTDKEYPWDNRIHHLFEKQAHQTPDNIAVIFKDISITYQQLNERTNQVAHYILKKGATIDTIVGVYMERSLEMVVAIMGILKAGAAYLPLDPDYPMDRVNYMIDQTNTNIILTQSHLPKRPDREFIVLDDQCNTFINESILNPNVEINADDLAYVIFTSGSTGKPKGVMNIHKAILNRILWMQDELHLTAADRVLQKTPFSFDVSVWEFFLPLISGARLVMAEPGGHRDSSYLVQIISEKDISVLHFVPSMLQIFLEEPGLSGLKSLKKVICSGEALSKELMGKFFSLLNSELHNYYGPTEAAIDVTYWHCHVALKNNRVPIGRPISNIKIYILDKHLKPTPIGVAGELHIGGVGLARGYINQPDLTDEKFILDPFSEIPGAKLYKTGDLARFLPDGAIEYLGRLDYQVKIRGFRIELGEIEAAISEEPLVSDVVVDLKTLSSLDKRLIAYMVINENPEKEQMNLAIEQVDEWSQTWNDTYDLAAPVAEPTFNTVGWNDSFSGKPFEKEVMASWLDHTVRRIFRNNPRQVLEIGCGTGMLLFKVAPQCEVYYGTDFSENTLSELSKIIEFSNVKLIQKRADEIDSLKEINFNMVIMNSVIQYFPSVDYLFSVIESAMEMIEPGGTVFLGDVRNLSLLETLHTSIELTKAEPGVTVNDLRYRIEKAILNERELLLDPLFFVNLKNRLKDISHVEILLKGGSFLNELTQYRYDVILHKARGKIQSIDLQLKDWTESAMTLGKLKVLLNQKETTPVGFSNVPNARLFRELALVEMLKNNFVLKKVGDLHKTLDTIKCSETFIDPEQVRLIGEKLNINIDISLSVTGIGYFDFICYKPIDFPIFLKGIALPPSTKSYANNPLKYKLFQHIVSRLKTSLKKSLPEYMIPSDFIFMSAIPLNTSGKTDRNALPKPTESIRNVGTYEAPETEAQHKLTRIWQYILTRDKVGIGDNFFDLGGHSLLAIRVISRIRETFEIKLTLQEFFKYPTCRDLAEYLDKQQQTNPVLSISPVARSKLMPLSFAQQRLWFLDQLEGPNSTYNMPIALRLDGPLNQEVLLQSFQALVNRHESLRTVFMSNNGIAVSSFSATPFQLKVLDLQNLINKVQELEIQRLANEEAVGAFDLSKGPLFRATLIQLTVEAHVLLLNMHHIVSDAWSIEILIRDLGSFYQDFSQGEPSSLPSLPIQYVDFASWQRQRLAGEILESQLKYWETHLTGIPALLKLPTDHPRPSQQQFKGTNLYFNISLELTEQLNQLSRHSNTTLFMTLLSAFAVLLYRYSNQNDIVIGTPITNRTHRQTESLVGFFVNTLALHLRLANKTPFDFFLQEVRQVALDAYDHQDIPFGHLVEKLNPERNLSYSPLFQVMFALQNTQISGLAFENLKVTHLEINNTIAKFDITLTMEETSNGLMGIFEYNTNLFEPNTIQRMVEHFKTLLDSIVENPKQLIYQLSLITETELQQFIAWNETDKDYPHDQTIVELFERQVSETPENIAVIFDKQKITYHDLNAKSNQIAHYLQSLGVRPEVSVGLCMERSIEMVIGLLAILKAGGAYVPLDPENPKARLLYMIADAEVLVLLTHSRLVEKLSETTVNLVCMDDEPESQFSQENPIIKASALNLAYITYTSGSTGQPKGVCIVHRAVIRLVKNTNYASLTADQTFLQLAPLAFDASTFEIWGSLLNGAKLVVMPPHNPSLKELGDIIKQYKVTILFITTSLFHLLVEEGIGDLITIRQLLTGGEVLSLPHVKKAIHKLKDSQLIICYGPTENTTFTSTFMALESQMWHTVPIGRPIPNTRVYVLDTNLQRLPIGIPGELYISGDGLARGYQNRPDLTASTFIPNPFETNSRLYRTGDMARYLPNGSIEFIGRIDNQVKMRGFRIELDEIETKLLQYPTLKEVVVKLIDKGNKHLVAWFTMDINRENSLSLISELREYLKSSLPAYMIPAVFVYLDNMPMTPNGKIDRKALKEPEGQIMSNEYMVPRTEIEWKLVKIWSEVLKQENIGVQDNFFELGGDSILSIQVIAKAREAGLQLSPRDLFNNQNVAELAHVARPISIIQAEEEPIVGVVSLLPIQQEFFGRNLPQPWHFNQSVLLDLPSNLNVERLRTALGAIIKHHDALRFRYQLVEGTWQQEGTMPDETDIPFTIEDISSVKVDQQASVILEKTALYQARLNLEKGPLLQMVLFKTGNKRDRLFWCIHHLVVDGVSWRILLEDLEHAYQQDCLPTKTTSYKTWAERLHDDAKSETLLKERDYWLSRVPTSQLILDFPDANNEIADTQHIEVKLDRMQTHSLLGEVHRPYNTRINDILLVALGLALSKYTGKREIWLDLEGHGRVDMFDDIDLSRTVGWFTSIYPVCLYLPPDLNPKTAIMSIKEQLRAIPHEGIGYGILKYLCGETRFKTRPEIVFNYLGQFEQESGLFRFATEAMGSEQSEQGQHTHFLEINGLVIHGCLQFTWRYSRRQFKAETIKKMAQEFIQTLQILISHCQQTEMVSYTPSDFPEVTLNQEYLDKIATEISSIYGTHKKIEAIYPLSGSQKGMFLESMSTLKSGIHIEQTVWSLSDNPNLDAFYRAWETVVSRHSALRGAFFQGFDNEPLQVIFHQVKIPVEKQNWCHVPEKEQQQKLFTYLESERIKGFPLEKAPLMRLSMIQIATDTWYIIWTYHHILLDGWCINIIFKELLTCFEAYIKGHNIKLEPQRSYRDYIRWLNNMNLSDAKRFWQQRLKGFKHTTALGQPDQENQANKISHSDYNQETIEVSHKVLHNLQSLSRQYHLTLNTVLQGIWGLLLSRYSGNHDVVFGTTVSGRPTDLPGVESIVGFFINTLPIRIEIEPKEPFWNWLKEIQKQNNERQPYEYCAGGQVHQWSEVPQSEPLFESLLVFENYPLESSVIQFHEQSVNIKNNHIMGAQTRYPLVLLIIPLPDRLIINSIHDNQRLDTFNTTRILKSFQSLLEMAALNLDYNCEALLQTITVKEIPFIKNRYKQTTGLMVARNRIEQQLIHIWEEVLEIRPIGLDDNFFDLGGHSLVAIKLMDYIQNTFNKQLPLSTLFQGPTIAQLAQLIDDQTDNPVWTSLVPIRATGSKLPLFCLPGAGGNVLYFHQMASYLGSEQPVVGLQSPGLDSKTKPYTRIEDLALHYIELIKTVQAKGPYNLCGHSFGSYVAFEMARQLLKNQEEIGLLAIFDTLSPEEGEKNYPPFIQWDDAELLIGVAEIFGGLQQQKMGLTAQELRQLKPEERLAYLHKFLEQMGWIVPGSDIAQLQGLVQVYKANVQTIYQPKNSYPLKIALFQAEESKYSDVGPDWGWQCLVNDPVEVYKVPGDHISMMIEPDVKTLAKHLTRFLK